MERVKCNGKTKSEKKPREIETKTYKLKDHKKTCLFRGIVNPKSESTKQFQQLGCSTTSI